MFLYFWNFRLKMEVFYYSFYSCRKHSVFNTVVKVALLKYNSILFISSTLSMKSNRTFCVDGNILSVLSNMVATRHVWLWSACDSSPDYVWKGPTWSFDQFLSHPWPHSLHLPLAHSILAAWSSWCSLNLKVNSHMGLLVFVSLAFNVLSLNILLA